MEEKQVRKYSSKYCTPLFIYDSDSLYSNLIDFIELKNDISSIKKATHNKAHELHHR